MFSYISKLQKNKIKMLDITKKHTIFEVKFHQNSYALKVTKKMSFQDMVLVLKNFLLMRSFNHISGVLNYFDIKICKSDDKKNKSRFTCLILMEHGSFNYNDLVEKTLNDNQVWTLNQCLVMLKNLLKTVQHLHNRNFYFLDLNLQHMIFIENAENSQLKISNFCAFKNEKPQIKKKTL